jgi:hypothetical protein
MSEERRIELEKCQKKVIKMIIKVQGAEEDEKE